MDEMSPARFHLDGSRVVEEVTMRGCAELGTPELPSKPYLHEETELLKHRQTKSGKENRTGNEPEIEIILKRSTKIAEKEIIYMKCHLQQLL